MCLVQFENIEKALMVIGFLQGTKLSTGRNLKISFTKSKIKHNYDGYQQKNYCND